MVIERHGKGNRFQVAFVVLIEGKVRYNSVRIIFRVKSSCLEG